MSFSGVFGEIIGIVVGLFVANNILSWYLPFIIPQAYLLYLPYSNATIISSGIVKILMHLSPWYRLKKFFEAIAELIGIISLYILLVIFPMNFAPINGIDMNFLVRFALTIALIITSVLFPVTCFHILQGKPHKIL
jgi:hypothetical protein